MGRKKERKKLTKLMGTGKLGVPLARVESNKRLISPGAEKKGQSPCKSQKERRQERYNSHCQQRKSGGDGGKISAIGSIRGRIMTREGCRGVRLEVVEEESV